MPAPIRRVVRKQDCKYFVERGLERLGYKVNAYLQEKLEKNECSVIYTKVDYKVETTGSYYGDVYISIIYNCDNNNELPYSIIEIYDNITRYLEESGAPWCTSFRFLKPIFKNYADTTNIELQAVYSMEIAWVH